MLVTGGARSGKSIYAQSLAESRRGRILYVATCPAIDAEMDERIRKHRAARSSDRWDTVEETIDLARVLRDAQAYACIVVDCLTLWINNLMFEAGKDISEEFVAQRCRDVLLACAQIETRIIFITNEVGMGIVPDNQLSRQFRDLSGRCNQVMAAGADTVTLVVCGLPLNMKGT
jgi:adenosylcobinamide kinase/adenosylcobinamide-phosphate guanylyltransferase